MLTCSPSVTIIKTMLLLLVKFKWVFSFTVEPLLPSCGSQSNYTHAHTGGGYEVIQCRGLAESAQSNEKTRKPHIKTTSVLQNMHCKRNQIAELQTQR